MRERFGSAELGLGGGREVDDETWEFDFSGPFGSLTGGDECSLRSTSGEQPVAIASISEGRVRLRASQSIDLDSAPFVLVSAPWFLHTRLIEALEHLDPSRYAIDRGLALFGKREARRVACELRLAHEELNPSQLAAVSLTIESDLAFVWGPPGTGKTTTLAHIARELTAHGKRVLLTSTTNAALDQALAKLAGGAISEVDAATAPAGTSAGTSAGTPAGTPAGTSAGTPAGTPAGTIVRLGHSDADTFGCQIDELTRRIQGDTEGELARLEMRAAEVDQITQRAEQLAAKLEAQLQPQQSLFGEPPARVGDWELAGVVPTACAATDMPRASLLQLVARRLERFKNLAQLLRERQRRLRRTLREGARAIVEDASVVLATLAHAYLSPALSEDTFDVVIIEEASMATLPTLFFAACLGREKTVVVGDPRQLPPIVASDSRLAQRALGRNIFSVAAPDPHASPLVALLDTQYRMVPEIGDLVGELFYDGRLRHGGSSAAGVAAGLPFADAPLIVVDTRGKTHCERGPRGRSRINVGSASTCAALALRASDGACTVAIITPYAAQARAIRAQLDASELGTVECSTIHRFQGQERDVVIIDLVDTADMPASVLLSDHARESTAACLLNVSMSRAAGKLILVADVDYFESRLPKSVANEVLRAAMRRGRVEVSA